MKLKTLKDFKGSLDFSINVVSIIALKQEAIKWLNEYPLWRVPRLSSETREWIKNFFNITEKDLK